MKKKRKKIPFMINSVFQIDFETGI